MGGSTFPSSQRPSSSEQPTSTVFVSSSSGQSSTSDRIPPPTTTITTLFGVDTRPTTNRNPITTQSQNGRPKDSTPYPSSRPTNDYSNTQPTLPGRYPIEHRYPTDDRYPMKDRYPSSKYPEPNSYGHTYADKYGPRPYDESYPTTRPPSYGPPYGLLNDRDPSTFGSQPHDTFNFYQDLAPTYSYPMLYEQNYPSPNDKNGYPNYYAQNVPTVQSNYYRPTFSTPMYGSTTTITGQSDSPPTNGYVFSGNPYLPTTTGGTGAGQQHPTSITYNDRYNKTDPYGHATSDRPPYRPASGHSSYGGTGGHTQEGNYQVVTEEPIETYFNPGDYYPITNRK